MSKSTCLTKWVFFKLTLFMNLNLGFSLPDNHYGDCLPKKCGDISISYPFHIIEQQRSYCGYPGFEVSCIDDKLAYFNISGATYVIKNVSYGQQTFQVVNSLLLDSLRSDSVSCSGLFEHVNLTLNTAVFSYAAKYSDIIMLLNCPERILLEINLQSLVICGAVAVYDNDSKLGVLEGQCNETVTVPYVGENRNVSNIGKVLEQGFWLKWTTNNCSACLETGGQCGYDQKISEYGCYCHDRTHAYHCVPDHNPYRIRKLLLVLGLGSSVIFIVISLVVYFRRRSILIKGEEQNVEAFLRNYKSLSPKRYRYADVKKMTRSFRDKLGEGGFGVVYKGKQPDGGFVAVKKLNETRGNGEDFINEVASISRTNHVNVVALLGFCIDGKKRALVYEFMANGSLEKFVYGGGSEQSLQWETLFKIAVGIARGLDYLHRGCNTRILHFDIKPHNILLDQEFCPKISDFGLAKLCPTKNSIVSMAEARGTIGFIAPEVFCRNYGGVSHKSDVYIYGMMVLDMACGRKNVSVELQHSCELYFPEWIYNQLEQGEELGTRTILKEEERELQKKLILVSLWCIQTYPTNRPSINAVVEMLEGRLETIQMPPKPHLFSPPKTAAGPSGTLPPITAHFSLSS